MDKYNSEKISSEEMGVLDNNSEWLGIPKSHLMECAGYSFASEVVNRFDLDNFSKVIIFCGTGNNGGDGFVVARHLNSYGIKSIVVLVGEPENIRSNEALLNWNIINNSLDRFIETKVFKDSATIGEIAILLEDDKNIKLIVDGLLGTGIKGGIREPIATAIEFINEVHMHFNIPVASIDVPSGLDPNTGVVTDKAVKADLVITFHRNKKSLYPKTEYIQELIVKSIGVPLEAKLFVGRGDLMPTLKVRKKDNYKGQFGRLFVIGGSKYYSGAPAYSSLTGIHFGCDLVITHTPEIIGDVLRSYSPNMIIRTSPGKWLNLDAERDILKIMDWANTIIIGPGMGTEKETEELLVKILTEWKNKNKNLVIDADGLKLVKDHLELIRSKSVILTPHQGEFKIMTGVDLPNYFAIEERGKVIQEVAKKLSVTLLVKGPYDFISDGKTLKINRTGCPEMAIGGTGDVLAGLCGCFLTTGNNAFQSACSAAFLNGYIGEYCKENIGPRFTALDMIQNINNCITNLNNY